MQGIIKSLLTEYGLKWTINRSLYSMKLIMMSKIPITEKIFEKDITIKRIDIFKFNTALIKDYLQNLKDDKKGSIILIADKAIDGIINGFSSTELNYGNPINWHLNPLTGVESKRNVKWYRIPDFNTKIGDIKVIWEASRFTHFIYFCRAYLITGKLKYYEAFSSQLKDWLEDNPYSYGVNYKCGQEATLRMINVLITYAVFSTYGLITEDDKVNIIKLVEGSY